MVCLREASEILINEQPEISLCLDTSAIGHNGYFYEICQQVLVMSPTFIFPVFFSLHMAVRNRNI